MKSQNSLGGGRSKGRRASKSPAQPGTFVGQADRLEENAKRHAKALLEMGLFDGIMAVCSFVRQLSPNAKLSDGATVEKGSNAGQTN